MATPILVTKLFIPRPRPDVVPRPHLVAQLNGGLQRKLSLVCAPAGFGKTTLVSEWVEGMGLPVAWLSVDDGDGDPGRFLLHLVAAVRTVAPEIGEVVLGALQSPQPPSPEAALTALLNEVVALSERFVLVLDDYHAIDSEAVDGALAFLVEHLPPQMHLVIATREDPQIPLARLRARGELNELRAADLRFTPAEAAAFLNRVMGLSLSAEDVAALEDRTEGWIAGLQLAALSLRGRQDASAFIRAFAGDHRYIVDYLVDEVLERQPEDIRDFLLQTAILDRLTGPLCDAVTGQEGGTARLEALERGNFFVVPLDDTRHWYRYHHLFADVLSAHLRAEQPEQVATLHRRASDWYQRNGSTTDAIRHALAGNDFERAADLVELAVPVMARVRREATALAWLKALPDDLIRVRPVLAVEYAAMLLVSGQIGGVEARLREAEQWLDPTVDSSEMVVVSQEEFRCLPGSIAVYRAGCALVQGDLEATISFAQQTLELAPEDDHLRRGSAAALLGLAYWTSGDLETGYRRYAEGAASVQAAGNISDVLGCSVALADIRIAQGRLGEAMRIYQQALRLAAGQVEPVLRGTADMHVGMSELLRERNDLPAATALLLHSKELGEFAGMPQNAYRWCVAMARGHQSRGDLDGALDRLCEAERLYVADFFPNVRPIAALKARIWLAQGMVDEALGWAREQDLSIDDELSYLREFDHLTLARVLVVQYRSDRSDRSRHDVLRLLERLLFAAEAGERTGRVIEILVVQALVHQARGDISTAVLPLERALTLAAPEGYVRMFVDEGPPMAQVLREAAARGAMPDYALALLPAFDADREGETGAQPRAVSTTLTVLVEPLSPREYAVLRLLNSQLSGPEIARELVVALSTIRTHTKRIYEKLDVTDRRAAVKRAAELGLI
jgi:LuxR family transcriptional regulator, maltose regulon positive regulatory protein